MNDFSLTQAIKELKTRNITTELLPLGYTYGYPVLSNKRGELCLSIPYLRYKVTGEEDKTLVFPIRYVLTFTLPEMKLIGVRDLYYENTFSKVDFSKSCGLFRHDKIKTLDRSKYNELRNLLFSFYDKAINSMLYNKPFSNEEHQKMRNLLRNIIEPSIVDFYKYIDIDFYNTYLK